MEPARAWRFSGDIMTGEDGDVGVPVELCCLSYILRRSIYKTKKNEKKKGSHHDDISLMKI
jgi:hypothetical protein